MATMLLESHERQTLVCCWLVAFQFINYLKYQSLLNKVVFSWCISPHKIMM